MAIKPGESYPTKTAAASSNYPYGEAQDVSAPGDGTGTPWTALVVNDWFGFFQGLLFKAGITPTGDPDTAIASQYIDCLDALYDQSADGSLAAKGLLRLSNDTTSTSDALAATIGAVTALKTLTSIVVTGTSASWTVVWGKLKMQGGIVSMPHDNTTNITLPSAYTSKHLMFLAYLEGGGGDQQAQKGHIVNLSSGSITNSDSGTVSAGWLSIGLDS